MSGIEPPRAKVHAQSSSLRISLAETGKVLAVVSESVIRFRTQHPAIKQLPVELPATNQQIAILTLKNKTLSPVAQLFIACVRELAKPIAKGRQTRRLAI